MSGALIQLVVDPFPFVEVLDEAEAIAAALPEAARKTLKEWISDAVIDDRIRVMTNIAKVKAGDMLAIDPQVRIHGLVEFVRWAVPVLASEKKDSA